MNNPYEENEDMMQACGEYENPYDEMFKDPDYLFDKWRDDQMEKDFTKLEEAEDALQVALATYHYNLDPINRAAARYAQGEFLMDALKDEGAL